MPESSEREELERQTIRSLIEKLPQGYPERYESLRALSHSFHAELGLAIQGALSADAGRLATMNLTSRREWAGERNKELKSLHLAFRCPKTGRPAILIADSKDPEQEYLRYRLQVYEAGHPVRTYTGRELPDLQVIEDDSRVESLSRSGRARGSQR